MIIYRCCKKRSDKVSKMNCTINISTYWLRTPDLQLESMSVMPQAWYSIKMSGLHSSSLYVEPDEASAVTECQHYTCSICILFSCCDKHTLTGWARACRGGPACAKMHQNLLDVPGTVDEDHGRGTLFQSCGRWREDRRSCSELTT